MFKKTKIALKRLLVGIWMLKLILMRSQMEIRKMLLETGGKAIHVIRWQRIWLNYVLVFCENYKLNVMDLNI